VPGEVAPQFELLHHLPGQHLQPEQLLPSEGMKLRVEQAHRPDDKAVGRHQQHPRVEHHVRTIDHQWFGTEPVVGAQVVDHHRHGIQNRGAQKAISRGLR
jgi:hypothetical protein